MAHQIKIEPQGKVIKSGGKETIKDALEKGTLDSARFRSYLKLKKEIRFLAIRKDQRARLDERAKWKKISQWSKQRKKEGQSKP